MKNAFLIDECLSPRLAAYALAERHSEAVHVHSRELAGKKDWQLMPYIVEKGYIFVTCNTKDFLKLCAREDLHPGLVIILPGELKISEQVRLFGLVLDRIEQEEDLVNKVVTIDKEGNINIFNWSKGTAGAPPPPGL